jgi:hypothetical protein
MKKKAAEITLRPFERSDFKRLISWVPTPEAHGQWCAVALGRASRSCRAQPYLAVPIEPFVPRARRP